MSANKYKEHVLVFPEDDAIRQIANGFLLDPLVRTRSVDVLPPAGGWKRVIEEFTEVYAATMEKFPLRHMVLLIDFDNQPDRPDQIRQQIPHEYADRVFVLGIASESEDIKRAMGLSFEVIGRRLAEDCRKKTNIFWGHDLLEGNAPEVSRLQQVISPFLFDQK